MSEAVLLNVELLNFNNNPQIDEYWAQILMT